VDGFDAEAFCRSCGTRFSVPRIREERTEHCPACGSPVRVGAAKETIRKDQRAPWAPPAEQADEASRFLVCMKDDVKPNVYAISRTLQACTGQSRAEITLQVARGMGILAEGLVEGIARRAACALEGNGIPAFAVAEVRVPAVARSPALTCVRGVSVEGVRLQLGAGNPVHLLPPDSLAACLCTMEKAVRGGPTELEVRRRIMPGAAGGIGGGLGFARTRTGYRARKRPPEPGLLVTMLIWQKKGLLATIAVGEDQVRYAYFGSRRKPGRRQNQALFLRDLMEHCPGAFFPARTRAVAGGDRRHAALLDQQLDYPNYCRWAACCLAMGLHESSSTEV